MIPDKREGPPLSEGPPEDDAGPYTPATTATTGETEDNTDVILGSRADTLPAFIFSEVSAVLLVASGDDRLRASDWRVLVNLCGRADTRRECFPGVPRIAHETGLHERTVRKSLAHLRDLGYLSSRPRRLGQQQRSSRRRLLIPDPLPEGHPYGQGGGAHLGQGPPVQLASEGVPYVGRQKTSNEVHQGTPPLEVERVEEEARPDLNGQPRSEEEKRESNGKSQDLTGFWWKGEWHPLKGHDAVGER